MSKRQDSLEEKEIERRVKVRKRGAAAGGAAAGGAGSKQDIQPPVEEQQVAELERTFTDRWEW